MTTPPAAHVILDSQSAGLGWFGLRDSAVSMTQSFDEPELAAAPPPTLVVVRGGSSMAPKAALNLVHHSGALVLRADVAKQVLAKTGLRTRPIPIVVKQGQLLRGWVMVEIDRWAPIDPVASTPDQLAWRPDRAPAAPLFRLVEAPQTIIATAEFAATLAKATGNIIQSRVAGDVERFTPGWLELPKLRVPARVTIAAEAAYARLARGERGDRKAVLAHPLYALALALEVDRKPRPDTRAAASRYPVTAVQYAMLVDRTPHATTRAGAAAETWCAYRYAVTFDRAIDEALGTRMVKSGAWTAENVGSERALLLALGGARAPTASKVVATRKLPKRPARGVPRIAVQKADAIADLEVHADIAEMTDRGLARLGVTTATPVPEVIDALHAYVDQIRGGTVKLGKAKVQLELACAFAEQLHRAFGWQWAMIRWEDGATVGLVSPDRRHAHQPLAYLSRIAKRRSPENTLALFFNMIAAGNLPKARAGARSFVS